MSAEQERLLLLSQLTTRRPESLNIGAVVLLPAGVDARALEAALERVVARHSALSTAFVANVGRGASRVKQRVPAHLPILEVAENAPFAERATEALARMMRQPFDLAVAPLWRAALSRQGASNQALLLVMHHAISDHRSLVILVSELLDEARGVSPASDGDVDEAAHEAFVRLQAKASAPSSLAYWREKLCGIAPLTVLRRKRLQPFALNVTSSLPRELVRAVRAWARTRDLRPTAVFLTPFEHALKEQLGAEDFLLAVPVDSRIDSHENGAVGFLSAPLLMRSAIRGAETYGQAVRAVADEFDRSFQRRHAPLGELVRMMSPGPGNVSRIPFFFNHVRLPPKARSAGAQSIHAAPELTDFAVSLTLHEDGDDAMVELSCQRGMFTRGELEELGHRFATLLEETVRPDDHPIRTWDASERSHESGLPATRFAIASTFVADPVSHVVEAWGEHLDARLEVVTAPVNQVLQQLLDPTSIFHDARTDFGVVLLRFEDCFTSDQDPSADGRIEALVESLSDAIFHTVVASNKPMFVGLCPSSPSSAHLQWAHPEKLAVAVRVFLQRLEKIAGVSVLGVDDWPRHYPLAAGERAFDDEAFRLAQVPYTDLFFVSIGSSLVRRWYRQQARPLKAVIVDGDNTLWRGVLGEDGVDEVILDEGHLALHERLAALSREGVFLCLCSKNDEAIVRAFFAARPDSVLRFEDFVATRVNWTAKSANVASIAEELGFAFDALLFLDDNPLEVADVRAHCPGTIALRVPSSEDLPGFLSHLWLIDPGQTTADDRARVARYQAERGRREFRAEVDNHAAFIDGLAVRVDCTRLSATSVARAAQLTVRTTQFNLTNRRRSEAEMGALLDRPETLGWTVNVGDRFGEYGLTGLAIAHTEGDALVVDTFLLSCRVLGRGVEHRLLSMLGSEARRLGKSQVVLVGTPTARNGPALGFLRALGAQESGPGAELRVSLAADRAEAVDFRNVVHAASGGVDLKAESPPTRTADRSDEADALGHIAASLTTVDEIARALGLSHDRHSAPTSARVATALSMRLSDEWSTVLGAPPPDNFASFFEAGGTSLQAVRLLSAVNAWAPRRVEVGDFFEVPTIAGLAAALKDAGSVVPPRLGLREELVRDVEAALASLPFAAHDAKVAEEPQVILVTGATGFVGSALLCELARRTTAKLVALVRAADADEGRRRLRSAFESFSLSWSGVLDTRVSVVAGDLEKPRFGVDDATYDGLASEVDWIYHAAARVDFVSAYSRLKKANVESVTEILRLALTGRLKAVHHISTLGLLHSPEFMTALELPEADVGSNGAALPLGYQQSKWVAERIALRSREHGVPVSIYRPGTVTGGAESGAVNPRDFFVALNAASFELGALPRFNYVDMVPVDFLARAIAAISLQGRGRVATLNLAHPSPISPEKLVSLLRFAGIVLELVSVETWLGRARTLIAERPDHPLAIFASLLAPTDPDKNLLSLLTRAPPVGLRATAAALATTGIAAPPLDARLLATYHAAMVRAGLLRASPEAAEPLLWFTETMVGTCGRPGASVEPATLKARASVSSIAQLLKDRRLGVTGTLTCLALDAEPLTVTGYMEVRPFSSQSPRNDGELVLIAYELSLRSAGGAGEERYRLRGIKTATPGGNVWREARTIDFQISPDGSRSVVAEGSLQIPPGSYFDEQVRNIVVDRRLSPNEQLQVKAAWLGFLGLSITRTYLSAGGAWLVRALAQK